MYYFFLSHEQMIIFKCHREVWENLISDPVFYALVPAAEWRRSYLCGNDSSSWTGSVMKHAT